MALSPRGPERLLLRVNGVVEQDGGESEGEDPCGLRAGEAAGMGDEEVPRERVQGLNGNQAAPAQVVAYNKYFLKEKKDVLIWVSYVLLLVLTNTCSVQCDVQSVEVPRLPVEELAKVAGKILIL